MMYRAEMPHCPMLIFPFFLHNKTPISWEKIPKERPYSLHS